MCATGQFRAAGGRLAPRQLPPDHRRDHATSAGTCRAATTATLPALASREHAGHARIYAIAVELIRHSDSRLDAPAADPVPQQLPARRAADDRRAVGVAEHAEARAHREPAPPRRRTAGRARGPPGRRQLRRRRADESGSSQALPRRRPTPRSSSSCCIACASTGSGCRDLRSAVDAHLAAQQTTAEDTIRGEHQRQAVAQVSVANAMTSLRLCATLDWQEYVEAVSLVEQVLQRDPAGAYGRMDFLSRDQQRQAVEALAPASGEGQVRVALKAIENARQAAADGSTADRAAHVGYHLVDRGRARSRSRPRVPARRCGFALRARAACATHPALYLGAIAALTGLLLAAAVCLRPAARAARHASSSLAGAARAAAGQRPRDRVRPARGRPRRRPAPAAAPRLLQRRSRHGADDGHRADDADQRRGRGRAARAPRGAGARQPGSRASTSRSSATSPTPSTGDCARRRGDPRARADGHRGAQRSSSAPSTATASSCSTATASGTRASRRGWAGSASAARSKSSTACCAARPTRASRRQVGDLDVLPSVRYCITLDSDTRLPRDAAQAPDRHHRAPAEPPALRPAAAAASPRATASCSRASA